LKRSGLLPEVVRVQLVAGATVLLGRDRRSERDTTLNPQRVSVVSLQSCPV